MARKKRDYKAEYARAKARAKSLGYSSQREYKRARKAQATPRRAAPIPKFLTPPAVQEAIQPPSVRMRNLRARARDWSDAHSHQATSEYRPTMSDSQVQAFYDAYVVHPRTYGLSRRKAAKEKVRRISEYVKRWFTMTDEEWKQKYERTPA